MADDELIYLDNNATTQLDPGVIEEMLPFFGKYYGNPSAGYLFAVQARKAVDLARDRLAKLLGCEPSEIVFTSGGTESNSAVINSALQFEPHESQIHRVFHLKASSRQRPFFYWIDIAFVVQPDQPAGRARRKRRMFCAP
jgi:cysteine desulfurase